MPESHLPLRIAAVGSELNLAARGNSVAYMPDTLWVGTVPYADLSAEMFASADLWLIGGPLESRYEIAADAIRSACHVFLEWLPSASVKACKGLAGLADEAGVEAGTNRPFWGSPLISEIPEATSVSQISISCALDTIPLLDLTDLCHRLSGNSSVRRVWATSTDEGSTLINLRFQNGMLASITQRSDSRHRDTIYLAGQGFSLDGVIESGQLRSWDQPLESHVANALQHFVSCIRDGIRCDVSISDIVETFRTIEQITDRTG